MPRARAPATTGDSPGTPGLFTTSCTASSSDSSSVPRRTSTPLPASLPASRAASRSAATTWTPRAAKASAAACPVTPSPTTSARAGSSGSAPVVEEVVVVDREGDSSQDGAEDPEPNHDLGVRPGLHLEVVVDRRHQEDPPAGVLEGDDLQHHRERLADEDPADDDEQELCVGH